MKSHLYICGCQKPDQQRVHVSLWSTAPSCQGSHQRSTSQALLRQHPSTEHKCGHCHVKSQVCHYTARFSRKQKCTKMSPPPPLECPNYRHNNQSPPATHHLPAPSQALCSGGRTSNSWLGRSPCATTTRLASKLEHARSLLRQQPVHVVLTARAWGTSWPAPPPPP